MKKILFAWISFVIALAGLVETPAAWATTWYFSDCQPGAIPGCVAGSEANNGTSASTPKLLLSTVYTKYNALAAGDSVLFADGSSWLPNSISPGQLNWLDNRNATAASPVTIGNYTPSWAAQCTGTGTGGTVTYSSTGMADSGASFPGSNGLVGCEIKVTESAAGSTYTQLYKIVTNTGTSVTLANYQAGDASIVNTWEYTPAAGATYTILPPQPLFTQTDAAQAVFRFGDTGGTFDHHGLVIQNLRMEGNAFARYATSATTSVITDSGLGASVNQYAGRTFTIIAGTCSTTQNHYHVASNTATTITSAGPFYSTSFLGPKFFTATLSGATSATLTSNWTAATGSYKVFFSTGEERTVDFTQNATTATWTGAITADVTIYYIAGGSTACTPDTTSRYHVEGASMGIMFQYYMSDVVMDGLTITGTQLGIDCAGKNAVGANAGNYTLKNSRIQRNQNGLLWGCSNTLIEANLFAHNGMISLDHQIYITDAQAATPEYQFIARGNRLTDGDMGPSGECKGVLIIKHGVGNGLLFENNFLEERSTPGGGCWGIAVDSGGYGVEEYFINVTMRGNTLVGLPQALSVDLNTGATIEDNNIYQASGIGIRFRSKVFETVTFWHASNRNPSNTVIRNNTVNLYAPAAGSMGIEVARNSGDPASLGGHKVYSNIVLLGGVAASTSSCFMTDNLTSSNVAIDYNACYSTGTPKWNSTTGTGTLTDARAAGYDTNSSAADPGVTVGSASTYLMTITSGSNAYNSGSPANSSPYAIGGKKRNGVTGEPSKGAHAPNAATVLPGTPSKICLPGAAAPYGC